MFKINKLKRLNKKSSKIISVIDEMKQSLVKNNDAIVAEITFNEEAIQKASNENTAYLELISKNSRIIDRITSFLD